MFAIAALTALLLLERWEYLVAYLSPANVLLWRIVIIGGSLVFLFGWFVLLAPASGRTRLITALTGIASIAMAAYLFRIEGNSGDLNPHLVFRWKPKADESLAVAVPVPGEAVSAVEVQTSDTDYPEFLGSGRHATVDGVGLATNWTAHPPKAVWGPQPVGAGWSGFSIVGKQAFTQEQRGEDELVTCYNLESGKLEWSHADRVRFNNVMGGDGPRATPTVVDRRVYALGATGLLTCLDQATGKQVWQRNIVEENKSSIPDWGKSCSPLVTGNLVIVSAGGPDEKSLVAYDRHTGEPVWSGGDDKSAYASPVLMTLAGIPQILIVNANSIVSHDPADGRVLWSHEWPGKSPSVSQSVLVGNDRLFVSKGYGEGCQLWQVARTLGNEWTVSVLWKNLNLKTKFTNVVVRDGFVYGLDEGILTCLNLADGSRRWKQGRYGHGQILLVGNLILVQAETGYVALVDATPKKFKELARFDALHEQTWNNPALSGQYLLVRNAQEAACYELPLAD